MNADLHAVKAIERTTTCPTKVIEVGDFVGAVQRGVFEGENLPQNLEAYNSQDVGAGSTKFTEAMATGQENIRAKFHEASSNG